jgi:hypothetical protein
MGRGEFGRNRQRFTGGTDRTEVEDLAIAARNAAIHRSALLTDDELRTAAQKLTGLAVGRAEVLAGFDRRLGDRVEGVRTLVVLPSQPTLPDSGGRPDLNQASQTYLQEVAARIEPRRVLGERLIVQGPAPVLVDLRVAVTVDPGTTADEVETAVSLALRDRLSPVRRSPTVDPWPLGRDLTSSDLESITANVAGVAAVSRAQVARAGEPAGDDPIEVPPDGLVVANEIQVDVLTDTGRGQAR